MVEDLVREVVEGPLGPSENNCVLLLHELTHRHCDCCTAPWASWTAGVQRYDPDWLVSLHLEVLDHTPDTDDHFGHNSNRSASPHRTSSFACDTYDNRSLFDC